MPFDLHNDVTASTHYAGCAPTEMVLTRTSSEAAKPNEYMTARNRLNGFRDILNNVTGRNGTPVGR